MYIYQDNTIIKLDEYVKPTIETTLQLDKNGVEIVRPDVETPAVENPPFYVRVSQDTVENLKHDLGLLLIKLDEATLAYNIKLAEVEAIRVDLPEVAELIVPAPVVETPVNPE